MKRRPPSSTLFPSATLFRSGAVCLRPGTPPAQPTPNEGKTVTTVKTRTALKDTDYIGSVTWVGDTSKGAMMITLYNALNTSGATLTINDKGEGTLPFEFVAHQSDVEQTEYAPYEIVYLNPAQSV